MGVNAEKTEKNRFFLRGTVVRQQRVKLAKAAKAVRLLRVPIQFFTLFCNFFIYFSIGNGLYTQKWMFFKFFLPLVCTHLAFYTSLSESPPQI